MLMTQRLNLDGIHVRRHRDRNQLLGVEEGIEWVYADGTGEAIPR